MRDISLLSGGYFLSYGADVYRFYSLPPEEIMLEDSRNPMCEAGWATLIG